MQDSFDQKKASILLEISSNSSDSPDASPKGTIDELCLPIIEAINSKSHMVTTSSCSGRVSVFLEGIKNVDLGDTKIGAKGNEGKWIFVTHDPKSLGKWYESVDLVYNNNYNTDIKTRYILFKFEPLILHVKCRDDKTAQQLYNVAMGCGFRESGIGSNNNVAIRISIKLDIPIGYLHQDKLVSFVSKEYLELITKLSLDRFSENFKKMDQLHAAIDAMNDGTTKEKVETKEERRQRKINEGLARRNEVREMKQLKKAQKEQEEAAKRTQKEQEEQEETTAATAAATAAVDENSIQSKSS